MDDEREREKFRLFKRCKVTDCRLSFLPRASGSHGIRREGGRTAVPRMRASRCDYSSEDLALAAETTSNCGGGGGRGSYSVGFLFLSEARVFLGRLLWWCLVDLNCGVVAATTCKVPLLPPARDTPLPQDLPLTNALVKLMVCSVSPCPSLLVSSIAALSNDRFVFSFRIECCFSQLVALGLFNFSAKCFQAGRPS